MFGEYFVYQRPCPLLNNISVQTTYVLQVPMVDNTNAERISHKSKCMA